MMDNFDAKRGMVKQLLDMLKKNASAEVGTGLQKPEGEDDMHGIQVEKVEVLPEHKMDEPTPEHDIITHEMNTGGMVPDSMKGQPDKPGAVQKEAEDSIGTREMRTSEENEEPLGTEYPEAENEPSSMFASFLGKKKRK